MRTTHFVVLFVSMQLAAWSFAATSPAAAQPALQSTALAPMPLVGVGAVQCSIVPGGNGVCTTFGMAAPPSCSSFDPGVLDRGISRGCGCDQGKATSFSSEKRQFS